MHYKNGKPAKVGDKVIGKDWNGNPLAGIVANLSPGSDTCNLTVLPLLPQQQMSLTARDCLLVEDALQPDGSKPTS